MTTKRRRDPLASQFAAADAEKKSARKAAGKRKQVSIAADDVGLLEALSHHYSRPYSQVLGKLMRVHAKALGWADYDTP